VRGPLHALPEWVQQSSRGHPPPRGTAAGCDDGVASLRLRSEADCPRARAEHALYSVHALGARAVAVEDPDGSMARSRAGQTD